MAVAMANIYIVSNWIVIKLHISSQAENHLIDEDLFAVSLSEQIGHDLLGGLSCS